MSDYTKATDFTTKDGLASGTAAKLIKGSEFDTEFDAVAVAVATKHDVNDFASQAQAEAETATGVVLNPKSLAHWSDYNGGMVGDIQALADPNADVLLGWDDSASAAIGFTLGAGLSHAATELNVADAIAGAGLTISSSILAVGAGSGITANANDVAITDVVAGAAQPVVITSGTFTFDLSSITEITIAGLDQAADGICISDAGVLKVMPYDEGGIKVVNAADAIQTFALTDANTVQVLDGTTTRVWTIPASGTYNFPIGTVILVQSINTATITITAAATVVLTSQYNTASTTATSDTVSAGGRACLIKVATDEWTLAGDISD